MAEAYRVFDQEGVHFVTFTVHQWVDVFTRQCYVDILLDNLRYCQSNKGLKIYGWVIMTNHCHLIISTESVRLSDFIRDFKKHTAKVLFKAIEKNERESRRDWLKLVLKKDGKIWFWEAGYHGEEVITKAFFDSKLNYIHQNPVKAGWVEKEEEYLWSSCGDYYGIRKSLLDLSEF
jgi:REP element-mobilizing transposase RayT